MEIIDSPTDHTSDPLTDQYHQMVQDDITSQLRSSASWFFWVSGLSILNTLLSATSKELSFFLGLGITQIVDGVVAQYLPQYNTWGYITNAVITSMFVFFGVMLVKRQQWALITGMVLYALDALIFLLIAVMGMVMLGLGSMIYLSSIWLAFAFHLFVLYKLRNGYVTLREARKGSSFIP